MKYSRFFCVLYLFLSLIRLIHLFTMEFFVLENWYCNQEIVHINPVSVNSLSSILQDRSYDSSSLASLLKKCKSRNPPKC